MKNSVSSELQGKISAKKQKLARKLIGWGTKNSPKYPWRLTSDPYRIAIAEMLLRKTRADAVSKVYPKFISEFPSFDELGKAQISRINSAIYSLGIKSRAEYIRRISRLISKQHGGKLPHDSQRLFSVIGSSSRYTVNAIRCFARGERVPIFDVNVSRVLGRVFSIDFNTEAHKNVISWQIAESLLPRSKVKEYNWALLDLGRMICTKKPRCNMCPLFSICDYARSSLQGQKQVACPE